MNHKYWLSDQAYGGLYDLAVTGRWCYRDRVRASGLSRFIDCIATECVMIDNRPLEWIESTPPGYYEVWSYGHVRKPRMLNISSKTIAALEVHAIILGLYDPSVYLKGRSHIRQGYSINSVASAMMEAIGTGIIALSYIPQNIGAARYTRRLYGERYEPEWTRFSTNVRRVGG